MISNISQRILFLFIALSLLPGLLVACRGDKAQKTGETAVTPRPPSPRFPGAAWRQYAAPEEAGWSAEELAEAEAYAAAIGSAAVLVVDDGAVVAAWGDVARRFRLHSVRKSLLGALIGVHEEAIGLERTLAELGVDDRRGLTAAEKTATVADLLTARSGVYHPAVYETAVWQAQRPERGSHPPGTFWYYNNWDFNVLLTIFEQETGAEIFSEFEQRIASPLQMQDYRPRDGYYRRNTAVSRHPAYPFHMSARDLARFGWMYLNDGQWQGEQIVPSDWVATSTRAHTATSREDDYGYLWWVFAEETSPYTGYLARGGDTQLLAVFPEQDLVIVHLADTYAGELVSEDEAQALLALLLKAKNGDGVPSPDLIPLPPPLPADVVSLPEAQLARYANTYTYPGGRQIEVQLVDGVLVIDFGFGRFDLLPLSGTTFLVANTREQVTFRTAGDGAVALDYETLPQNPLHRDGQAGPATTAAPPS
jgi:CubicO group peptidase (beta-lactamase class C family)